MPIIQGDTSRSEVSNTKNRVQNNKEKGDSDREGERVQNNEEALRSKMASTT